MVTPSGYYQFEWSGEEISALLAAVEESGIGQTTPQVADNIDTISATGLYSIRATTQGTIPVVGNAMLLHLSYGATYAYEYYYLLGATSGAMYRGCILRRTIEAGVIGPWEWVNPPLQIGVEYRTTERYQGKPVYAKAVSLGAGPDSNTKKTVQHGIGNMSHIVDYGGEMYLSTGNSNPISLPGVSVVSDEIYSFGVNYRRFIWTSQTTALTTYTGIGWIKYTKSTD